MSKIRRIVLYKHGVGFFEREFQVDGDADVRLEFKQREVNDVLKSLSVIDLGGGTVSNISYDSSKPTEELLKDVGITLPEENPLEVLLTYLKGIEVELSIDSEVIRGVIVGIESVEKSIRDTLKLTAKLLTIMKPDGTLSSFDLLEVRGVRLVNESAHRELKFCLDTLASALKRDSKSFTIKSKGAGKRKLLVSYVVEAPVWKASYRVILQEGDKKPLIQGWALVDNTGTEDWEDVELSLVSGRPISFIHDLHTPRFMQRPVVAVERFATAVPREIEEGLLAAASGGAGAEPCEMMEEVAEFEQQEAAPRLRAQRAAATPRPSGAPMVRMEAMTATAPSQAVAREVGDFFEYKIGQPVTVKRSQSALVPIVSGKFDGIRVLHCDALRQEKNPMACMETTNTTGLTLEGGPVTVIESDLYAGEAMMPTLKPNDKRLVPYAVEMGCIVDSQIDTREEDVHFVRILHGSLFLVTMRIREKVYTIKNKSPRPRVLYVDHPADSTWNLVDGCVPIERTPTYYRFKVELAPEATTRFVVGENMPWETRYDISTLRGENCELFLKLKYIDQKTVDFIGKVQAIAAEISEAQHELGEMEKRKTAINQDQERIRQNLTSIGDRPDEKRLRTKYLGKLEEQEAELEEIEKRSGKLRETIEEKRAAMAELVGSYEFSRSLKGR